MTQNPFEKLASDMAQVLSGAAGTAYGFSQEMKGNLQRLMQDWLSGLNLVKREEFDALQQLAANTRTQLEALQQRVAALEAAANQTKTKK